MAKVRFTVNISPESVDKARNAVFWTPGLTLAELVERSVSREVERLAEERGEPFPERARELTRGKPIRGVAP